MDKNEARKGYYKKMREWKEQYEDGNKKNPIVKPQYRMNEDKTKGQSKGEGR